MKVDKGTTKQNYMRERERGGRERNGAPKSNVLTSGFRVTNPKSGPDYSAFIKKLYISFDFTYPVRRFSITSNKSSRTLGVCVPQVEDHWSRIQLNT
jgi:hypothetical protein